MDLGLGNRARQTNSKDEAKEQGGAESHRFRKHHSDWKE